MVKRYDANVESMSDVAVCVLVTELKTNTALHQMLYMLLQAGNFLNTVCCFLHLSLTLTRHQHALIFQPA